LNAGDIDGAITYINKSNLDSEKNIINKAIKNLNDTLLNLDVKENAIKQYIYTDDSLRVTALEKNAKEKKILEEKILLIRQRIELSDLCNICFSSAPKKCVSKCCNNIFCFECVSKWLIINPECALCKTKANLQADIFIVKEETVETEPEYSQQFFKLPGRDEYTSSLDKFQNLERIVATRTERSKFLIFSDYEHSFSHMYSYLDNTKLRYSHIKGNSILNTVEKYKGNQLDALLINSKNYGSGLNLENTTDVILFHKFDSQLQNQIIGRAQRPGRKQPLKVWFLLNENEL
jgi:SNF2 family DNA or RNA helicase